LFALPLSDLILRRRSEMLRAIVLDLWALLGDF